MSLLLALAAQAVATAPAQGTISYPPTFFAAQRPANAFEMLERTPGFTLDHGATVRGFEGAAGNVLIDGQRPTSKTDNLQELLERIPAGKVERIDIVRGGAPGLDMQGKPLVANVILTKDTGWRGQLSASYIPLANGSSSGALEAEASGSVGERKWAVSLGRQKAFDGTSGVGVGLTEYGDGRPPLRTVIESQGDGHYQTGTGAYEQPLAGGRLKLNARFFIDKFKFEEDVTDLAGGLVRATDQATLTDDYEAGGSWTRRLGAETSLELIGLFHPKDLDIVTRSGPQVFELSRDTYEAIGRAVVKRRWSEALWLEAGGETAQNRLDSRTRFRVNGADVALPAANVQVEESRFEAFAKASWRPADGWTADAALRAERSTISSEGDVALNKTLSFIKPRLALSWAPDAATQLRLRVERDVGQLDFEAFVASASLNTATGVTAGNPDLEPEQAWLAEGAVERRFWGRGAAVLTFRHSQVQAVVDRGPVFTEGGVFDRPTNIGDGYRRHLKLELTLPLERLGLAGAQLKGVGTRRWTQVADPTTGQRRGISGVRKHDWELHFTQDLPTRNMTWGASTYSGWQQTQHRFNAVDQTKLGRFYMLFTEWRPRTDLSIRAEAGNLGERSYRRTTLTYPGPRNAGGAPTLTDRKTRFPRNLYVRVRKTFGP